MLIKHSEIEQLIAALPEGTSQAQVVEALRDKGFDVKSDEQGIKIEFEGIGTLCPDPRFIWSLKNCGFSVAMNMTSEYMCLTEVENAIDSVEVAAFLLERSTNLKWKWIMVSLHHSLYSYMIAALTGGNSATVKDCGRKQDSDIILEAQDGIWRSTMIPYKNHPHAYTIQWTMLKEKPEGEFKKKQKEMKNMIGFWTALARVMDGHCFMNRFCIERECALKLTENQWNSIIFATEVRNSLVHFSPAIHTFDLPSMKTACAHLLEVIEFMAFLPLYIRYENNGRGKERVKLSLAKLRKHCISENK